VLTAFGLAVPPGLDGRPLIGADAAAGARGDAPAGSASDAAHPAGYTGFTDEEAALIAARLADLGYLE
jgi:hypothetical protein